MPRITLTFSILAISGLGLGIAAQQKKANTGAPAVVVYKSPT